MAGGARYRPCAVRRCTRQGTRYYVDESGRVPVSVHVCPDCFHALVRQMLPQHAGLQPDKVTRPGAKVYAPLTEAQLVAALQAVGGSAKPRQLAIDCRTSVHAVRRVTRRLLAKGRVTVHGKTAARVVRLVEGG